MDCDPVVELRKACAVAGTQKAWAEAHGLSTQYVSDVLRGKPPGSAILSALGIERVYRHIVSDPECTDCGGTGVTYQTERRCSCQSARLTPPATSLNE